MIALLVDDSAAVRARLAALLAERCRVDVRQAHDPASALAIMAEAAIAVVVLDLHLAGVSGLDLLSHIKSVDPAIAVVVLTNESGFAHERESRQRGADYFFDKAREFERAIDAVVALAEAAERGDPTTGLP
jgi:DNA-binding NtrC family response regulator